jgi:hypothetical protein
LAAYLLIFYSSRLAADGAIFEDIQRGLTSPDKPGPGSIGAREERVHAFQSRVVKAIEEGDWH